MRIYNARLGKFLSVDPLSAEYPWNSTYAFAENGPIQNLDLDGCEREDFMTHMNRWAYGGSCIGVGTFLWDWYSEGVYIMKDGMEMNVRNEYMHRTESGYTQTVPADVQNMRYTEMKWHSTAISLYGVSLWYANNQALMGGLEMGAMFLPGLMRFGMSPTPYRRFYTVQNTADGNRLMTTGSPWPKAPYRASMGKGVYTFDNKASALRYMDLKAARFPQTKFGLYSVDVEGAVLGRMNTLDTRKMNSGQIEAWDAKHNALGNPGATPHGYDLIIRQNNYGTEYYFNTTVFPKLRIGLTNNYSPK